MKIVTPSISAGIYSAILISDQKSPELSLCLDGKIVAPVGVSGTGKNRKVEITLPIEAMNDDITVLTLQTPDGTVLDLIPVVAGGALQSDLSSKVAALQAELDLVKRALRELHRK